jgi:imidazolonepropionase-like amidohydrolase
VSRDRRTILARRAGAVAASVVAARLLVGCAPGTAAPGPPLAITHVTLIDGVGGAPRADVTVLVVGRRVGAVGAAGTVAVPAGARVVDGRGRFLIPGLWDMHAHAFAYDFPRFAAPLLLANGVTGVRDMGYYVDSAAFWRREVAAARVLGPRLVVGGRVDGPGPGPPWVSRVATADDARRAADSLVRLGADFLKVYSRVPREAYVALADAARRLGVPLAGHVPYAVSVAEASDAGQRSVEHEDDLMRACSSRDAELRAALGDRAALAGRRVVEVMRDQARAMRASDAPARCRALLARLARNGTWVVPTLTVYQPYAHALDSAGTRPERLAYVPRALREAWRRRPSVAAFEPRDTAVAAAFFSLARTGEMRRAGVRLLVGTDAPLPYVVPGFSVHDELELLVRAGLTPMQALQAATREPAVYLDALDSLGAVAPGRLADLVLLDADPLADIRNTTRIHAVIADGHLIDRAALDAMLATARRLAK